MAFVKFKPIISTYVFFNRLNIDELDSDVLNFLSPKENLVFAFKSVRDILIFTDKRVILIDKKGINGFRKSIYGILYESISSYNFNVGKYKTRIEFMMESSHRVVIDFSSSISLNDIYDVYKYITESAIKN